MADRVTEKKQDWQVKDLLDLDYFLALDADQDEADLQLRDKKMAEDLLRPAMGAGTLTADASTEVRSRGLWLWLQQRKQDAVRGRGDEEALLPGQVFFQTSRMVKWLGGILMLLMGVSLVFSLLHVREQYFNVMMFLVATLLPQLALLILLIVGALFRKLAGKEVASGGVASSLLRAAMLWLSARVRRHHVGDALQGQWRDLKDKSYLLSPVLVMTQTMAVFYNVGLLLGFGLCLLSRDVRFFWESTPGIAAVEAIEQVVKIVATPWGSLLSGHLPTYDEIAATRVTFEGSEKVFPSSEVVESAAAWVPFLTGALLFWGLLPRLLLRWGVGFWAKSQLRNYGFVERRHRELWRRLTALRVEVSNAGPGDEAVVLLWGGLQPDEQALRKVLLQQLRLNPVETFVAGNDADAREDVRKMAQVTEKVVSMEVGVRLVVVV
ncbi:MAG: DUF2868 domain-containing protein, partial [Verrucomicrobiales bacterium]|nr:DUF2868 domain-containing protein [Verrucomicrobiales bacterium]